MNAVTPIRLYPSMDAAIKEEWIAALESGNYEQGRGQLRCEDNTFCCLGVLYDITKSAWVKNGDGDWATCATQAFDENGDVEDAYEDAFRLPPYYRNLTGLSDDAMAQLMHLNDTRGFAFSSIANWIKENL